MFPIIYHTLTNKLTDKKRAGGNIIEWCKLLALLADIAGNVTAGPESSPPEINVNH